MMLVQVNTDNNVTGGDGLAVHVKSVIMNALAHFAQQITRVEVHLSDENGPDKSGAEDKRCVIEVRLAGQPPMVASHAAPTVHRALDGAASKMKRQVVHLLGKLAASA